MKPTNCSIHFDRKRCDCKIRLSQNYGAFVGCGGRCGKTYYQCMKKRKVNSREDKILMNSLEQRYNSWMQTIRESWTRPVHGIRFGDWIFKSK